MKRRTIRSHAIAAMLLAGFVSGCPSEPSTTVPTKEPTTKATPTQSTSAMTKPKPPTISPVQAGGPARDAVEASNHFGFDLYQKLREQDGSFAYSPASISLALSMTFAGAKGDTAKEMAKVMHLPEGKTKFHGGWATVLAAWSKPPKVDPHAEDDSTPAYELAVANRLFGEKTYKFEQPFLKLTKDRYGAPLEMVDFAGAFEKQRLYINSWVEEQTRKRIKDLIPQNGIDDQTRLVLTNALYFKAKWLKPFREQRTKDGTFTTEKGESIKVPMMHHSRHARYGETDDVQVLELPYAGGRFAMVFALPKKGKKLGDVEAKLSGELFQSWLKAATGAQVNITLPRFKIDPPKSVQLSKTLIEMGMKLAFQRTNADFTGIGNPPSPEDKLYISKVFHKAFVAVDEKGTEAAAATAVVMTRGGGMAPNPVDFTVDRPFLFFIRDKEAGLIMFAGRVHDPRAKIS